MLGWLWMAVVAIAMLLVAPFTFLGTFWGGLRPLTVLLVALAAYLLGRQRGMDEAKRAP